MSLKRRNGQALPIFQLLVLSIFITLVSFNAKADEAPPPFVKSWGDEGLAKLGNFVANKSNGDLYVMDTLKRRVLHFNKNGRSLGTFSSTTNTPFSDDDNVLMINNNIVIGNYFTGYQFFTKSGDFSRSSRRVCFGVKATDKTLYVVAETGDVFHYDSRCNLINTWKSNAQSVIIPQTLAIVPTVALDKANTVYVTSAAENKVELFTAEGDLLNTWDTVGFNGHITDIAITNNDDVFVVNEPIDFLNPHVAHINHLDINGNLLNSIDIPFSNEKLQGAFYASRLAAGYASQVYYGDNKSNEVKLYDADGTRLATVSGNVKKASLFVDSAGRPTEPSLVQKDMDGGFYVLVDDNKLKKFSKDGVYVKTLSFPNAIKTFAVSPLDGSIYVTNYDVKQVMRYDTNMNLLATIGTGQSGENPGDFSYIVGFACDKAGNLLVSDLGYKKIQVFNKENAFVREWQVKINDGIVVDDLDNVYLYRDNAVIKYSTDGVLKWGRKFKDTGIVAVTVDHDNNVYTAFSYGGTVKIKKLSADGKLLSQWGSKGNQPGQFSSIAGIAAGDNGDVLVSDAGNNRVQLFSYQ